MKPHLEKNSLHQPQLSSKKIGLSSLYNSLVSPFATHHRTYNTKVLCNAHSICMSMGSMLRSVLFPPCHHLRTGGARRLPNERRLAGAAANARWRRVTVATDVERRNHLKAFIARSPSTLLAPSEISVLLCGEGDFSFTRALASGVPSNNHQNHMSITATSYEPVDEIKAAWGGAANLQDLEKFGFVDVIHGVDATALDTMFPNRKWDKICFMFPHIAGKGKISLNRKLLAVSTQSDSISHLHMRRGFLRPHTIVSNNKCLQRQYQLSLRLNLQLARRVFLGQPIRCSLQVERWRLHWWRAKGELRRTARLNVLLATPGRW